ncbi:MAG: GNAT family N-acetyltransferase [Sporichthyaceae bacterium]|jgi:GNAT superfamily N-acetyltransferase
MRLRSAVPADAPAIATLMRESVAAIFPAFYDARQTASAEVYIAALDHSLISDGTYFVVETEDGTIAACGGWSRRSRLHAGAEVAPDDGRLLDPATEPARVRAMFVRADFTRRGLGRMLLEACERAAREEGYGELALMATLPGVPLYRSWGFGVEEPQQVRLPDGVVLGGIAMRRPIS